MRSPASAAPRSRPAEQVSVGAASGALSPREAKIAAEDAKSRMKRRRYAIIERACEEPERLLQHARNRLDRAIGAVVSGDIPKIIDDA
jgi:hypothetical protein